MEEQVDRLVKKTWGTYISNIDINPQVLTSIPQKTTPTSPPPNAS